MADKNHKSILVVDDSSTVRQQLRRIFEDGGYTVIQAVNGAEGLAVAQAEDVDLIVSDVNMPIMDGIEMVAEIRKLDAHQKTPIFMLTTESGGATAARGKTAGANAWIVKPLKPAVILKGANKVLGVG